LYTLMRKANIIEIARDRFEVETPEIKKTSSEHTEDRRYQ